MSTSSTKLIGSGLAAASMASLCCIAPLLAALGGATGALAVFSWVEPLRPYLIGGTVAVLAFAWYQRLKSNKAAANCGCEEDRKSSFWKTNKYMLIMSCLALLLLAFPEYAGAFYRQPLARPTNVQTGFTQTVELKVKGMTCEGCEAHVNREIGKLTGVFSVNTSYKQGSATITYDSTKVKPSAILQVARKTGYTADLKEKN